MLYIKDMNSVEILILSQSETEGKFNGFPSKAHGPESVWDELYEVAFQEASREESRSSPFQK